MMTDILTLVYNISSDSRYRDEIKKLGASGWRLHTAQIVERGVDETNRPSIFVMYTLVKEEYLSEDVAPLKFAEEILEEV